MAISSSLLSSKNEHYGTPQAVFDFVRSLDAMGIGLDPCANSFSRVRAKTSFIYPTHDGLEEPWEGHGIVYVNPPYGAKLSLWARKIEHEAANGVPIVSLTPARTDTRWFQDHLLTHANAVLFWRGRLTFDDLRDGGEAAPNVAPFPSVLVLSSSSKAHVDMFKDQGASFGKVFVL